MESKTKSQKRISWRCEYRAFFFGASGGGSAATALRLRNWPGGGDTAAAPSGRQQHCNGSTAATLGVGTGRAAAAIGGSTWRRHWPGGGIGHKNLFSKDTA